jgi:hypothetical protein
MVLDANNKIIRMQSDWRLPYTYDHPYTAHLRPSTGINNSTILKELLKFDSSQETTVQSNSLEIISSPTNPSIVTYVTVIG